MRQKKMHYLEHHCGPQECDCEAVCNVQADEYEGTGVARYVTCKNCIRYLVKVGRISKEPHP